MFLERYDPLKQERRRNLWCSWCLGTALTSWLFPLATPFGPGSFAGRPIYRCQQTLAKPGTDPQMAKGVCCQ